MAVAILSMAVAGPLTLGIKNVGSAATSQDQITAFYLAQEATEYVRNIIDTNILNDTARTGNWLERLETQGDCSATENGCYFDINEETPEFKKCPDLNCSGSKLQFDGSHYALNVITGAEGIPFNRVMKIGTPNNGDEAIVTVTISWKSKFGPRSFILVDDIYHWRKID